MEEHVYKKTEIVGTSKTSIEEAVQLSTKVGIVTPRPGRIDRVIDIDLPWPRDLTVKKSQAFTNYMAEIQEVFHGYGVI